MRRLFRAVPAGAPDAGSSMRPALARWAERQRLERKSDLTVHERGQLAALRHEPCSPPADMDGADEDAWCEGWSDYGEED